MPRILDEAIIDKLRRLDNIAINLREAYNIQAPGFVIARYDADQGREVVVTADGYAGAFVSIISGDKDTCHRVVAEEHYRDVDSAILRADVVAGRLSPCIMVDMLGDDTDEYFGD